MPRIVLRILNNIMYFSKQNHLSLQVNNERFSRKDTHDHVTALYHDACTGWAELILAVLNF